MTEYKEIIAEAKDNSPRMPGPNGYLQGELILIVQELREMNKELRVIAGALRHIDSGVI